MIAGMERFAGMFTDPGNDPRTEPPTQGERGGPRWRGAMSLRWVLLHMVEEYARHNGRSDLLRQRIDEAVGQ